MTIFSPSGWLSKIYFLFSTLPETYILWFKSILNTLLIKIDNLRPKDRSMFFHSMHFLKILWVGLFQISPVCAPKNISRGEIQGVKILLNGDWQSSLDRSTPTVEKLTSVKKNSTIRDYYTVDKGKCA